MDNPYPYLWGFLAVRARRSPELRAAMLAALDAAGRTGDYDQARLAERTRELGPSSPPVTADNG